MEKSNLAQISKILHRALNTISQSTIDKYIQTNAEFRAKSGLSPMIIRTSSGHCCEWCNEIAGKYKYPDVPKDVYRRHDNCDCTVEYINGKIRQNVWNKRLNNINNRVKIKNESRYVKLKINLFNKSDVMYFEAFSIEEEPPYQDVCCHGNQKYVEVWLDGKVQIMDAHKFAEYLTKSGKYNGKDLRFNSCSVGKGENSFAQQLSKELHIRVKAPDDDAYYDTKDGIVLIGSPYSNLGSWRIFENGDELT